MNKAQKEVIQANLNDEKKTIRELKQVYGQARKDCEAKIRELSGRTDLENLTSIIYQKQYQEALKKQLDGICDTLNGQQFTTVADYLQKSYQNGYIGTMYDLHKQGIPITVPIDQRQVVKALQTDSKLSGGLYKRMGEDVSKLKTSIRAELSRGISQGKSWNEIATHIANGMNSPFGAALNRTILISRTEGHRVQQQAALDAQFVAKEKGADIVKQWCATLDDLTRPEHQQLDGQIVEVDEDFTVDGYSGSAPGMFGDPYMDCNCRCCILQRAKWGIDEDELETLYERAEYFGLNKNDMLDEYYDKYLHLPENADTIDLGNPTWVYKESKTIREAEDFARGFGVQNVSYKGADIKVANAMNQALTDAFNYYPGLSERINFYGVAQERNKAFKSELTSYYVGYLTDKFGTIYSDAEIQKMAKSFASKTIGKVPSSAYAFASNTRKGLDDDLAQIVNKYSGICVNKTYASDFDAFTRSLERDNSSKFHPVGCDTVKSVFDHEFGHQIDYSTGMRDDKRVKDLWSDFLSLSTFERDDALSRYAYTDGRKQHRNCAEFIAEGYSEYVNSDNPREYAKAIGEIVDELTKK